MKRSRFTRSAAKTAAEIQRAGFQGTTMTFSRTKTDEPGDVLIIPKAATGLTACREEFFRLMGDPRIFLGGAGK
jgi:hypothetical protein